MPGIIHGMALGLVLGVGVQSSQPQTAEIIATEPTSDHLEQLNNIREGLLDPEARPENRRRFADLLLSYGSPEAKALTVELLSRSDSPDVQRALCGAIADRARRSPERLDESYVQPLLNLLDSEGEDLRTKAARALADFPGGEAARRLGQLAARGDDVPIVKRLAAIDALAPNTHRREVVGMLMELLDADVPQITERVLAALEPATVQTFGSDLDAWRRWWQERSRLDDEAWLAEQLHIYRDRSRRVADEFQIYRDETRREHEAITARLRSFQRDLFRVLNGDQREARLAEWLDDPLPVIKLTALAIIKARIADEGKRPEGQVLSALLRLLKQGSPEARRGVLEIVQNLKDPVVVEAVLAQLRQERDPTTRHAILRAIGKFDSPAVISALIEEIANPQSPAECIREAAIALGNVTAKSEAGTELQNAAAALKNRYRLAGVGDVSMRAALLDAMAGVADPAFGPEFLDAVESDDGTLLRPAIRGILAVDDTSKLPRLRTLMAHPDPLVRLAAIEAIGQLGHEAADMESLLTRLNKTIETNEAARDAAWRGFRALVGDRPVADRIKAAERLRDRPDLEVKYLAELADALSVSNGAPGDREVVLDRLAMVLTSQGRYAEAVAPLKQLYDLHTPQADDVALGYGLRLLDATLRSPAGADTTALIGRLAATASDDEERAKIVDAVAGYLESPEVVGDPARARVLYASLSSVPAGALGDAWSQMLERVAAELGPSDTPPPVPPTGD